MSTDSVKRKREHHTLSMFLEGTGLHHEALDGDQSSSPHDGWICSGDEKKAAVELTGYVFGDHQAILNAWQHNIWKGLDGQRRQHPALKNLFVHVELKGGPRPLQNELEALTRGLIQIIQATWEARETLPSLTGVTPKPTTTVWVEDRSRFGSRNFRQGDDATFHLDPAEKPLVAKYVTSLQIVSTPTEWPEWWGPDMNGGISAPDPELFKVILDTKRRKAAKYQLHGKPLWLVITCGDFDDVQTHFLPGEEEIHNTVIAEIQSCGFDFASGPFAQVWLYSVCNGKKALIYPKAS